MRMFDGIEVINALVDDELIVTQEDIDKAVPLDHENCALAIAWKRGQTNLEKVRVYKSRAFKLVMYFGYLKWIRYNVSSPIKIQQAVLDNGGRFSPGTYIFKRMNKSQRIPGQQGSDKDPNAVKPPKSPPTVIRNKPMPTPMRTNAPTQST